MPIQIIHKFTCDMCPAQVELIPEIQQTRATITGKSDYPENWYMFRDLLLCPEHEIKKVVFIDGKEV